MEEPVSPRSIIRGLRAVRTFKPDPIEDEKVREILEAAIRAPNASNAQPWHFVVVTTPDTKAKVREIAIRAFRQLNRYVRFLVQTATPPRYARLFAEALNMVENTDKVPALIFVFGDPAAYVGMAKGIANVALKLRLPRAWRQLNLNLAASVYPAVQNMLLAAQALGVGSCLTTSIILRENEVKQLLRVPGRLRLFTLIYLGYPATPVRPPRRRPIDEFVSYEVWGRGRTDPRSPGS